MSTDSGAGWVTQALEEAELARKQKRYDDGIALLVEALEHEVLTDSVYFRLGNIYFDAGDVSRAEYSWLRAIEVNPDHVNAHYNLSALYKKTGRIAESVRMQKRAVRLQTARRLRRRAGALAVPTDASGDPDTVNDNPADAQMRDPAWSRFFLLQGIFFVILMVLLAFILIFIASVWLI